MRKVCKNIAFLIIILILAGFILWRYIDKRSESYVISEIATTYAFDHNDLGYYIRDVDYAFVARVNKVIDTTYEEVQEIEGKEISTPYTNYSVCVQENIKGHLPKDSNIQVTKMGGISKDGKKYYLCEEDIILEDNKFYVFLAYAQPDGELLVAGMNSTIETDKKFSSSDTYQEIKSAMSKAKKAGDTERKRYKFIDKK